MQDGGSLIKNGTVLQEVQRFKSLCLIRQGLLPLAQPLVTDVVGSEARVLTLAASLAF